MTIHFHMDYRAAQDEQLVLNMLQADGTPSGEQYVMSTIDHEQWLCEVSNPLPSGSYIDYFYSIVKDSKTMRTEWLMEPHRLEAAAGQARIYYVYDHWLDIPEDSYLYTSAFTDCVTSPRTP